MNYFELFEIPVSIKNDRSFLSKKYAELQRKYHPDFYTQLSEEEQQQALEISSSINKALKVLQNEDATIKYILQLKNILEEEEKYKLSPDFLMEMMELNEEEPESRKLKAETYTEGLYNEIKPLIENYNDGLATEEQLLRLKAYYYQKKYLQRILDRTE
ncbi:Fe-S protein assembly co-chaperone HscB [Ferruginibacter albus]|uniref:Fe-S protein assembly co-chaperone HscB n=1 Tax=Ferruginibacter albus TaxID=2875540 RepID=UPI001CC6C102|nr:Fe-S protein assembly co-chaperone HscB [Ferruginibacter albus]UAY53104.1 Fe-S protein assembly co-chaperone HscB [Ferruginibacter albus]